MHSPSDLSGSLPGCRCSQWYPFPLFMMGCRVNRTATRDALPCTMRIGISLVPGASQAGPLVRCAFRLQVACSAGGKADNLSRPVLAGDGSCPCADAKLVRLRRPRGLSPLAHDVFKSGCRQACSLFSQAVLCGPTVCRWIAKLSAPKGPSLEEMEAGRAKMREW